ncbi:hypothetical protein [Fusobacterium ulcerans]|jgi:hypothetical protein|uniref:hypothetical protein n=1 Tax=Fusobacterium ulcerans TaxID=861 RepID=UPI0030AEA508
MKVRVENKSKNKIWIGDFCFIPGISTADVTEKQQKEIEHIEKNNPTIAKAIEEKIIKIEFAENFKETKEEVKTEEVIEKPKK